MVQLESLTAKGCIFLKASHTVCNYISKSCPKGNFHVNYCRNKVKIIFISVTGLKLWNDLDRHIHKISFLLRFGYTTFWRELATMLFL